MRLILTGIIFVIGGLSGTVALRGTGSSGALALVGIFLIVAGAISANNDSNGMQATDADRERDDEQWAEYQRTRAAQAAAAQTETKTEESEPEAPAWDPRRERLEALLLMTPGARGQIDDLLTRTGGYLNEDEQLNVALDTARRLHQSRTARA